jgi:hypothetical protein
VFLRQRTICVQHSFHLQVAEHVALLHVCLHLVAQLVKDQTQGVNVLLLVYFQVLELLRPGAGVEVSFDLRSHVSFSASDTTKPRNHS